MGEGDAVVEERQAVADTGGDHARRHASSRSSASAGPRVDIQKAKTPGRPSLLKFACSPPGSAPTRADRVTVTGGVHGVAEHEPVPGDQLAQAVATRDLEGGLELCAGGVALARHQQRPADVLRGLGEAPVVAHGLGQLAGALERRQRPAWVRPGFEEPERVEDACLVRPVAELMCECERLGRVLPVSS